MPSVGPRQGSPSGGRNRAIVAAVTALVGLGIAAASYAWIAAEPTTVSASPGPSGDTAPTASPSIRLGTGGYLIEAEELRRRAELAREGVEPNRSAVESLLREADQALDREPKPENPLGRKGQFLPDTHDAYTLALAWVVTDDSRYARHAAEFIRAWVEGVDETRDTCPDSGGSDCATSLLVSRNAPGFVFAADLLEGSGALSDDDEDRLRGWLATLILPAASQRTNNWGDAGIFMRLAVADYIGDATAFAAAVDGWRDMMDLVTSEGQIPEETRRGSLGLLYTQGAISFKVGAATIAERRGVDLWSYEGELGGTLRSAIDNLARYWEDPQAWPWHDGRLDIPSVDPAWEVIYERWPDPAYARIFAEHRPFGTANPAAVVWTTLTHGEPLEEGTGSTQRGASSRVIALEPRSTPP